MKVRTVCMSHLSDVQELVGFQNTGNDVSLRCNFVKFLLLKFSDTNTEIDPDKEYSEFSS